MKIFKNFFSKNIEQIEEIKENNAVLDKYSEIGKLVKEARIQRNISVEELSRISKIPAHTISSIENNIETIRPKYPFIRSILFKLEECLSLKKNILVRLLTHESKSSKKDKNTFIIRKFDFINTWEGTVLYFFILISSIFILKKYFFSNISIIEIQNFEQKIQIDENSPK